MDEVLNLLYEREYYQTVARGFLEDAVRNALRDNGYKPFPTLDSLDRHIRENYI